MGEFSMCLVLIYVFFTLYLIGRLFYYNIIYIINTLNQYLSIIVEPTTWDKET